VTKAPIIAKSISAVSHGCLTLKGDTTNRHENFYTKKFRRFWFFCRTLCWKKCGTTDFTENLQFFHKTPTTFLWKITDFPIFSKAENLQFTEFFKTQIFSHIFL
jgi:hypothetical protein